MKQYTTQQIIHELEQLKQVIEEVERDINRPLWIQIKEQVIEEVQGIREFIKIRINQVKPEGD
tara:strand:- start:1192 stop:1380 length:189 start_codon:yes stop_codon:yes gene_type:complete